ncbi:ycei family protein [Flammeovirgaceae bacterium 311]|nr:ycei family protein [Flammeovirgaceae bacterium 311]
MKLNKSFYALLMAGALFAACDSKPAGDVAEVGEAQEVSDIQSEATFAVDKSASKVAWIGLKPGGRHYGTFGIQDGALEIQNGEVAGGNLVIDLNDIDVKDLEGEYRDKLTGHLKSPDFFDVANSPTGNFVITSVTKLDGTASDAALNEESRKEVDNAADQFVPEVTNPTHRVTGNLTLRDTTLSVTFPAQIQMTDNGLQAKARFVIDRTNWGITFRDDTSPVNRAKDEVIYNNVAVGFDLNAKRQ